MVRSLASLAVREWHGRPDWPGVETSA
jgi:hypothetical protein